MFFCVLMFFDLHVLSVVNALLTLDIVDLVSFSLSPPVVIFGLRYMNSMG